jgi:hypothetical protein
VPGYKDVINMIDAALWAATVKVLMEPIPVQSRNITVSAEFFDDKISEYLHASNINPYVRFFTRKEANQLKLNPDHIIKLEFDEFTVGQVFLYEKEIALQNDSVQVGAYIAGRTSQSDTKDTGNTNNTDTSPQNNVVPNNTTTTPGGNNTGATNTTTPSNNNNTPSAENKDAKNNQQDTGNNNNNNSNTDGTIAEGERVTICHIPPGNESARHTLIISRSALAAHLAHGDTQGSCEDQSKGKKNTEQKPKADKSTTGKTEEKKEDKKENDSDKGKGQAWMPAIQDMVLFASANNSLNWLGYTDTLKIYNTVKATLYYSRKTTTSKGIVSFKIIDAKTNALLAIEKMPGEYVWASEWATFNGDERALTSQQLQLCKQKEKVPPPPQDLFIEFTRPIYEQVTTKIRNFYKNY